MNRTTLFICGTLCGITATVATMTTMAASSTAQPELDPLKLSPQLYTPRFENDYVRVYEYRIKPGVKDPMHAHPHGLVYVLAGGKMRSITPEGAASDHDLKAGDLSWREATLHALENTGTSEMHALSVELKPCPVPAPAR